MDPHLKTELCEFYPHSFHFSYGFILNWSCARQWVRRLLFFISIMLIINKLWTIFEKVVLVSRQSKCCVHTFVHHVLLYFLLFKDAASYGFKDEFLYSEAASYGFKDEFLYLKQNDDARSCLMCVIWVYEHEMNVWPVQCKTQGGWGVGAATLNEPVKVCG